jgi:XrtJ-associated TM-motif-TM protein
MKKCVVLLACAFALVTLPVYAQGVCVRSPENPTLILAGLAGGAYTVSAIRIRIRARRKPQK